MRQLLHAYFGFSEFRPGQEEVIGHIIDGQSAAAIFPTGSGKSLCYQLPALYLPHLTLVVSPLLALMQDQLDFLRQKNIPAASIDSTLSREEANSVMQGVRDGKIKILMISVERLNNERFRQFICDVAISLLVVDEAHCISEWGHNFRPDYLKLPRYRQELGIPQTLLLTATATPQVIEDMGCKFGIGTDNITLTGFYRANLHLSVVGITSDDKLGYLSRWLAPRQRQSGIVYVTLQQTAEEVARQLQARNIHAQAYHAGMDSEKRQAIQQRFMSGEQGVIVATIAFGMGIDKSDIRFVVHFDLPKSIENYAQEIGRAGRDGKASDCLVLANGDNLNVLENFVYGDTPEPGAIDFVLAEIEQAADDKGQWEIVLNNLSTQSNIRVLSLKTLLVYLEMARVIKPLHSYFAEYRFKLLLGQDEIMARFDDERGAFINALFDSSDKAKIWFTANLDKLQNLYPCDRQRAIRALDYLDQHGLIELQTKQMTQVYRVLAANLDREKLRTQLSKRFSAKEASEVERINKLVSLFTNDTCLSIQLAQYFADSQLTSPCGHCSVCQGQVATLPPMVELAPLSSHDFGHLCAPAIDKLAEAATGVMLARYLCGLTTPIFTRHKLRSSSGFGRLEKYRFADVLAWVNNHIAD